MAWSYALLDTPERQLFERLAVFGGGFTLEAAQASALDDVDALQVLPRLVAKSMVQAEPQPDGSLRYRVLEPLRQFGYALLVASGALDTARQQHAEYILALGERSSLDADLGGFFRRWFELNPESDNIHLALDWAVSRADTDLAVRLGAALWMWWSRPDRQAQGRFWLERIMALPDVDQHPLGRGEVVVAAAHLAMLQSDMGAAIELAQRAHQTAREAGDHTLTSIAGCVLGTALALVGQSEAAEPMLRESAELARRAHVRWVEMLSIGTLGHIALGRGNLVAAEAEIRECLRVARDGADPWSKAMALTSLGDLLRAQGHDEQAGPAYTEALAQFESLDPHRKYAPQGMLHNLGYVALAHGDVRRAASLFLESADTYRAVGSDRRGAVECVVGLACTAVRAGKLVLAAQLFGTAEAELERLGTRLTTANRSEYERGLVTLTEALPAEDIAAARADGARLALDDALDLARPLARDGPGVAECARARGRSDSARARGGRARRARTHQQADRRHPGHHREDGQEPRAPRARQGRRSLAHGARRASRRLRAARLMRYSPLSRTYHHQP
jgi:tetratricopeptide (TPR) repeat protein